MGTMTRIMSGVRVVWPALLAIPLLASCYLPDRFQSEIRVNPDGSYGITYAGVLTWIPLFMDTNWARLPKHIQETKPKKTAQELKADNKKFFDDLKRDNYFSVVEPMGNGAYNVRYKREGRIVDSEQVTFVRRNAALITLSVNKKRVMTIQSKAMSQDAKKQLASLGLQMRGLFRVVTQAKVIKHNAQQVKSFQGYNVYDWNLTLASPTPKIVLQLR